MDRVGQALALVVLALTVLVWPVPQIAQRSGRPRFVVALVLGALAVTLYEAAATVLPTPQGYERLWVGQRIDGLTARGVAALNAAVCAAAALGLWQMRAWGRLLAMAYLAFLIGSFLIWGLGGAGREDLGSIMLWQMFVLPFLVFGLMYLQRGAKYFRS